MYGLQSRVREGATLTETTIIDCHAHLGPFSNLYLPWNDAAGMLEVMDEVGTDIACISANLGIGPDFKKGNDQVAEVLTKYPGRFAGYVTINPGYQNKIQKELERCFKCSGFFGIKLHNSLHGFTVEDDSCIPIWEYAQQKQIPILSHGWESSSVLQKLSNRYPDITFIVAHATTICALEGKGYLDLARNSNNVFLDITSSTVTNGSIARMVNKAGADRILFGTDFPWIDVGVQLGNLLWSDINENDKIKILGENMQKILKKNIC